MIKRTIRNSSDGKEVTIELSGCQLTILKGKRTTEKAFSTEKEALKEFYKAEWSHLKKGFLFYTPQRRANSPLMHRCVGGGYTGALSIASHGETTAVYQAFSSTNDKILFINREGELMDETVLPGCFAWKMQYSESGRSLYIDLDHAIYEYQPETKTFRNLTPNELDYPGSFFSVSNSRILSCRHPELRVTDAQTCNETVKRRVAREELYGGHSVHLAGAISGDGRTVAFCSKAGEIIVVDIDTMSETVVPFSANLIKTMEFLSSSQLLVTEAYGERALRILDLQSGEEQFFPQPLNDACMRPYDALTIQYALCKEKIALITGRTVQVYNYGSGELLNEIYIEHAVRSGGIAFADENTLAVRTDYGCLSFYSLVDGDE